MQQILALVDSDRFVVAFYTRGINPDDSIPADAIAITPDAHEYLLSGQEKGLRMQVLDDGTPRLVEPPPPTPDQSTERVTVLRDAYLRAATERIAVLQDAVDLGMATEDEREALTAWRRYRLLLSRVDVRAPEWPASPDMAKAAEAPDTAETPEPEEAP